MWRYSFVLGVLIVSRPTFVALAQDSNQGANPHEAPNKATEPQKVDVEAAHRTAVAKGLEWIARQQCSTCHVDPHGKDVALAATWLGKQECIRCHFTVPGKQAPGKEAPGKQATANTNTELFLLALGEAGLNTTPGACTRNADRRNTVTYLGVGVTPVSELLRRHVKLPAEMGLLVESVEADSPAKSVGVEPYDILEKINEQLLVNQEQFSALIRSYRPGTPITLSLIRANQHQSLSITLTEREVAAGQCAAAQGAAFADFDNDGRLDVLVSNKHYQLSLENDGDAAFEPVTAVSSDPSAAQNDHSASPPNDGEQPVRPQVTYLGVQTSPPPPALVGQLKLPPGLFLLVDGVDDGSPAAEASVRAADILQQLDDQVLVNSDQLGALIRGRKAGDEVSLTLTHEGRQTTVRARLTERDAPASNTVDYGNWVRSRLAAPSHAGALAGFRDAALGGRWEFSNWVDATDLRNGPAGATNDEEFVRRVYLDLIGAPPTHEETHRFLDDTRADKRKVLIDELLGRPDVFSKFKGVSSLDWSDTEHALHLTSLESGGRHLVAKDQAGGVIFEGAVDTDDQRIQLPPAIAAKLALMLQGIDRRQSPRDAQSLLERVISITAKEAPLKQVVDMLRKETGANIVLNVKALKAAGTDLDEPLTFELRDVKLATALKTIAKLLDGDRKLVGYTVEEDVILISTKE